MNYQQVKQYLTIVKHMNLSKAAEELYISQPALSLALGRLESELDVQLFYREGKKADHFACRRTSVSLL